MNPEGGTFEDHTDPKSIDLQKAVPGPPKTETDQTAPVSMFRRTRPLPSRVLTAPYWMPTANRGAPGGRPALSEETLRFRQGSAGTVVQADQELTVS